MERRQIKRKRKEKEKAVAAFVDFSGTQSTAPKLWNIAAFVPKELRHNLRYL
jgi:hypothetical protein